MIGLSPVRTVTVTIDGVLYEGTYFVQQQMIHVRSQFGAKAIKGRRIDARSASQAVALGNGPSRLKYRLMG